MIPKSWKDITVGQYQQACKILADDYSSHLVDEFEKQEAELTKQIDWMSVLCGVSPEYLYSLPKTQLYKIAAQLNWINDIDSIPKKFPKIIFLNGKLLRPMQNVSRWTTFQAKDYNEVGKWKSAKAIDFNTYAKERDTIQVIHKLVAIICKWGFRGYNGRKLNKHAEFIRDNMSMAVAYPIAVFFCTLSEVALSVTSASLARQMTKILKKNKISMPSQSSSHG